MDVVPDSTLQNLSNPAEEVDENAYENPGRSSNAMVGPVVHTFS